MNLNKLFFIKTLGCKVNQYESQAIRESLIRAGFKECRSEQIADIFILNTCTVTGQADKESRRLIKLFRRTNPSADIAVTGCYAESAADELSAMPGVTHIIKNSDKGRIAQILENRDSDHSSQTQSDGKWSLSPITDFKDHTKAFIKIQDGCDNFCSYCKVPYVRPRVISRSISDITEEALALAANGFKEIVLTGVCLGAWGKDLTGDRRFGLIDVLGALEKVKGDFRVRLSSIEPGYVTDELIEFISGSEWMCRHLHIPMQSGDSDILKKMLRPYTAEGFRLLVDKAKARIKGLAVTTDVMIGFPGESEANFKNTLGLVKYVSPLRTHIFTFDRRKGTAAYNMPDVIPNDILRRRYIELRTAALAVSYLYRRAFLNTRLSVLVENRVDPGTGFHKGYTDNYIKIFFRGDSNLMRKMIPVKIEHLNLLYTFGAVN